MSQCVSCSNQPNTNDSLGGAAHEGTVTPMVVGIIVGTVIVFIIVVCALFYCVKLENRRYMTKVGEGESDLPPTAGGGRGGGREQYLEQEEQLGTAGNMSNMRDGSSREVSVKSRHSSVTIQGVVPQSPGQQQQVVREVGNAGGGGKRRLIFGWGKKGNNSTGE